MKSILLRPLEAEFRNLRGLKGVLSEPAESADDFLTKLTIVEALPFTQEMLSVISSSIKKRGPKLDDEEIARLRQILQTKLPKK